jgi:tRNA (guanine37-N1)-methyltransferase
MTTVIRAATSTDPDALAELAARTFPLACPPGSSLADQNAFLTTHLSAERFAEYLRDQGRTVLVAAQGERLVGYAMTVAGEPADPAAAQCVRQRPTVELSKCYVDLDQHGTGISGRLITAAVEDAGTRGAAGIWLGVNQLNARAIRFYTKQGFTTVGTKHFVLGASTEDDFVLERTIDGRDVD